MDQSRDDTFSPTCSIILEPCNLDCHEGESTADPVLEKSRAMFLKLINKQRPVLPLLASTAILKWAGAITSAGISREHQPIQERWGQSSLNLVLYIPLNKNVFSPTSLQGNFKCWKLDITWDIPTVLNCQTASCDHNSYFGIYLSIHTSGLLKILRSRHIIFRAASGGEK